MLARIVLVGLFHGGVGNRPNSVPKIFNHFRPLIFRETSTATGLFLSSYGRTRGRSRRGVDIREEFDIRFDNGVQSVRQVIVQSSTVSHDPGSHTGRRDNENGVDQSVRFELMRMGLAVAKFDPIVEVDGVLRQLSVESEKDHRLVRDFQKHRTGIGGRQNHGRFFVVLKHSDRGLVAEKTVERRLAHATIFQRRGLFFVNFLASETFQRQHRPGDVF